MSRVTVRGCILFHMRVVVIISQELLLEHPPTNCSGSSKYSELKSQVGTSNLSFSYTELPFNCTSQWT